MALLDWLDREKAGQISERAVVPQAGKGEQKSLPAKNQAVKSEDSAKEPEYDSLEIRRIMDQFEKITSGFRPPLRAGKKDDRDLAPK